MMTTKSTSVSITKSVSGNIIDCPKLNEDERNSIFALILSIGNEKKKIIEIKFLRQSLFCSEKRIEHYPHSNLLLIPLL